MTALVAVAAAVAGDRAAPPPKQRDAILSVMSRGRDALLAGKARRACSLLTHHGRLQALRFGDADFDDPPRTCRGVVRREWEEEHGPNGGLTWSGDLRNSRFRVARVKGRRATVKLKVLEPYGPTVTFRLRKTEHGWRIHDSDAVPYGD
ncbi:MAG TPA: hypothetical protein VGF25_15715 [Thermoleophilaceae bacterium]